MTRTFAIRECEAGRTKTGLIINNGSERGDYIACEEIQRQFTSPHDGIQLMKTYYPSDPKWNDVNRISKVHPDPDATYAWDYDYDDYHPLLLTSGDGSTQCQMEDIKQVGADVHLTVTLDMSLCDEELGELFGQLRNMGRVYLRINHEANGLWFRHNKLHSYKEVGEFFVRCHELVKRYAPNVKTVFSLTGDIFVGDQVNSVVTGDRARLGNRELFNALNIADYWSIDKYVTLNWGWPHSHPKNSDDYFSASVDVWWRLIEEVYLLMIHSNGGAMKPLFLHEFNSDADVVGEAGQASAISEVYRRILQSDFPWLEGICLYQYCDEAGLGLFRGTADNQTPTESLVAYQEVLKQHAPRLWPADHAWTLPHFSFSWENSRSIKGISVETPANTGRFMNCLGVPAYFVQDDAWSLVKPGDSVAITSRKGSIFVPPNRDRGQIRHVTTIKHIDQILSDMFLAA